jgi:hypothetical protein
MQSGEYQPTLRWNISPPPSGSQKKPRMKPAEAERKVNMEMILRPKRRAISELHGVATQKAEFFQPTAMRTSNTKSTIMSSYIMSSHFASMLESADKSEMLILTTPPPKNVEYTLGLKCSGGTRHSLCYCFITNRQ